MKEQSSAGLVTAWGAHDKRFVTSAGTGEKSNFLVFCFSLSSENRNNLNPEIIPTLFFLHSSNQPFSRAHLHTQLVIFNACCAFPSPQPNPEPFWIQKLLREQESYLEEREATVILEQNAPRAPHITGLCPAQLCKENQINSPANPTSFLLGETTL